MLVFFESLKSVDAGYEAANGIALLSSF